MSKNRVSKTVVTDVTRKGFDAAFAQYAKSDAELVKVKATLDAKIATLREAQAEKIAALESVLKSEELVLGSYVTQNKDELFKKAKSFDTSHGSIGFRTDPPKVTSASGFTLKAGLVLLKASDTLKDYVRTVDEIDKDKILADRKTTTNAAALEAVGLKVVQTEKLFIKLNKEPNK